MIFGDSVWWSGIDWVVHVVVVVMTVMVMTVVSGGNYSGNDSGKWW